MSFGTSTIVTSNTGHHHERDAGTSQHKTFPDFYEGGKEVFLQSHFRVVPASPSYFTAKPQFTDDYLALQAMLRKHQTLPSVPASEAPRVAWKTFAQYRAALGEDVKASRYSRIVRMLQRLNLIDQSIMPEEVRRKMQWYKRDINPFENVARARTVDHLGKAIGVGRRKSSSARVYLVEGEGEVLINGKTLVNSFPRVHDRESAIWPLTATDRIDKYNVWALVSGGGTTGQAEALTLGLARALLVHEPMLKPALRRAGCVTRDPRRVERKKPGKLKARKMPAWVKR
ncbi:MAG: hypothetical protein M4579_005725 [Chaenotheca gracillima]|nr:MAG: hypothetical protein M4579_005725 [Chaenotheca gracillima]